MPKYFTLLIIVLIPVTTFSQNWEYYEPYKAKGEVPNHFTEAFTSKFNDQKRSIATNENRKTRKRKEDFHEKSEYFIDEFLTSGKVFFGDTITNYCRAVLDKVIGDNLELKNSISLYTVKTPTVNAITTANGIIFVNIGLIAQLETEAQLAYILSHELIHFTNDHVVDQYIEQEKIRNGEDLYRRTSEEEKITQLSNYSKTQEFEADVQGYEKFFIKTGYNTHAPYAVMDILEYSHLPFDEIKFDTTFFNDNNYKIPGRFFKVDGMAAKEEGPPTLFGEEEVDDQNSSHPNISKRRNKLKRIIKEKSGDDFLISERLFKHCRRIARYEICRLHLTNREYAECIYTSYLLLQNYPNDRYLRLSIAKALHGLSVYSHESELIEILRFTLEVEGESKALFNFFNEMSDWELSILTLNYTYNLKKDFPDDKSIARLYNRAMQILVFESQMDKSDFFWEDKESMIKVAEKQTDSVSGDHNSDSKVAKLKSKKIETDITASKRYWRYAFVDFAKDREFIHDLEDYVENFENNKDAYKKSKEKRRHNKFDDNVSLNIDKALCLAPQYLKLDFRGKSGIQYSATEKRAISYRSYMKKYSELLDLDIEFLDYKFDSGLADEQLNETALLQNWLSERMLHVNHDILVSDFDYIESLITKYDTRYLIYTGNLTLREKERNVALRSLLIVLAPYVAPLLIYGLVVPNYESFNFFFLFDLKTGNALLAEYNTFSNKDSPDYIKSLVYNYLLQVSSSNE